MAANRVIGKWQLGETLGKGGYGVVAKGLNIETGDFVAVKQVPLKGLSKDKIAEIQREIDLLKYLKHKHIVKYIDNKQTKDHLYIVMEYVENGSLADVAKKFGKIPEPLVALYIQQVLKGLKYLHEEGVIHRDIKGANVLTTKESNVKLADFGVASKLADADSEAVAGTPYWMAPEIIELNNPTTASDIWSLGCTVIELLTGKPPYYDLQPMTALFRIVQDSEPPIPPGCSSELQDFLRKCFIKKPEMRKTAGELLEHPWLRNVSRKREEDEALSTFQEMKAVDKELEEERKRRVSQQPQKPHERSKTSVKQDMLARFVEDDTEDEDYNIGDIDVSKLSQPKQDDKKKKRASKKKGRPNIMHFRHPSMMAGDTTGNNMNDISKAMDHKLQLGMPYNSWSRFIDKDEDYNDLIEAALFENIDRNKDEDDVDIDFASKLREKKAQKWDPTEDSGDMFDAIDEDLEDEDDEAQASAEALDLISKLSAESSDKVVLQTCEKLQDILKEYPGIKGTIISLKGVLPITEMLDSSNEDIIHAILKLVNLIIEDNRNIQETLCLMGVLPTIMDFAKASYHIRIRMEAALFIHEVCHTSAVTLQMFIACRGLPVLVEFLDQSVDHWTECFDLICMSIDDVLQVFNIPQSRTPKNDFCRLFAKSKLLTHLSRTLDRMCRETGPKAQEYTRKMVEIFLLFSQADSFVKGWMAQGDVLRRLVSSFSVLSSMNKLTILTSIKHLSIDHRTLDPLHKAGVIPMLVKIMDATTGDHVKEMHNQALNSLFHLCIEKRHQEIAAEAGIIPHLQKIINEDNPLKQLALPMICKMAYAGKIARRELWKHNGVLFYLDLLKQGFWQSSTLEAITAMLSEETKRVENILKQPENIQKLIDVFKVKCTEQVLTSFEKILMTSKKLNQALGSSVFVRILVDRIRDDTITEAVTRVTLLKVLLQIYEFHPNPKQLIQQHNLFELVKNINQNDKVLVSNLVEKLLTAFESNLKV